MYCNCPAFAKQLSMLANLLHYSGLLYAECPNWLQGLHPYFWREIFLNLSWGWRGAELSSASCTEEMQAELLSFSRQHQVIVCSASVLCALQFCCFSCLFVFFTLVHLSDNYIFLFRKKILRKTFEELKTWRTVTD